MSKTTVPVFKPTLAEFRNFSAYIDKIDEKIGDFGLCKVIPPKGWYPEQPKTGEEVAALFEKLKLMVPPIRQYVSGARGAYSLALKDSKKVDVEGFKALAAKVMAEPDPELSYEEVEKLFWRKIGPLQPAALYGADMAGTLFQGDASGWNLSKLDNMIKLLPDELPGITTAMLYFGMWRAMFAFHTEDMNLYSINYLHCGRPKSWYSIPPHAARRFESMAQGLDPDGFRTCSEHLRHKTSMFSPKVLKEAGIPFHTLVQEPGEFVITFPRSYHAGFNHGFNVAEATNFTTERWIDQGRDARVCRCQPYSVHINMDTFEEMLAQKRAKDEAQIAATMEGASQREKDRALAKLEYTGWLAWQAEQAAKTKAQQDRAQKERLRLKRQAGKKMAPFASPPSTKEEGDEEGVFSPTGRKRGRSMAGVGVGLGGQAGSGEEGAGTSEAETSLEDLTDHGEEWEFACCCGESCTSQSPADAWPQGVLFQCKGCETWAHAQCLYGKAKAPRLAFCDRCHDTLQALVDAAAEAAKQGNGKPLPPVHTGRQIRLRSRVIVCRGPRGLEEGVVTMFGEGNARVHYKARAGEGTAEEWLTTSSCRFLSMEQVTQALAKFDFSKPFRKEDASEAGGPGGKRARRPHKAAAAGGASAAAGGYGQYPYPYPYAYHGYPAATASFSSSYSSLGSGEGTGVTGPRGVPLPDAAAAVAHAKFMKDLQRRKKALARMYPNGGADGYAASYYAAYGQRAPAFDAAKKPAAEGAEGKARTQPQQPQWAGQQPQPQQQRLAAQHAAAWEQHRQMVERMGLSSTALAAQQRQQQQLAMAAATAAATAAAARGAQAQQAAYYGAYYQHFARHYSAYAQQLARQGHPQAASAAASAAAWQRYAQMAAVTANYHHAAQWQSQAQAFSLQQMASAASSASSSTAATPAAATGKQEPGEEGEGATTNPAPPTEPESEQEQEAAADERNPVPPPPSDDEDDGDEEAAAAAMDVSAPAAVKVA